MVNYKNLRCLYMDDINAVKDIYYKDILNYLNDMDIDPQPNAIEDAAAEIINNDYDDLLTLVNTYDYKHDYDYILVVADFGLWYGRRQAQKTCYNLKDAILCGSYDYNIIYFKNNRCTLEKASEHHDGTNNYKYYKVKNGKKYAIKYNDLINIAL